MKIILISNLYEPYSRGGAEVIVKNQHNDLVAQGHDVKIITMQPFEKLGSLKPKFKDGVYRFYPLNVYFYPNDYKHSVFSRAIWHFLDLFNIYSAAILKHILLEEEPDLVITHNLMGLSYWPPRIIKQLGIKHHHVLHDIQLAVRSGLMFSGEENKWWVKGLPAKIYQFIVKWMFGSPDKVISPSKFLLDFYTNLGYFKNSEKVIKRNKISDKFAHLNKIDHDGFNLAYIGQIAKHKGIELLLKAFSEIKDTSLNLHIIGSGPLSDLVVDYASKDSRIIYHGRIDNQRLPEYYAKFDCIVLPTLTYENSPTVVMEALAANIPLVVSDIGGTAELIENKNQGIKVKPGSVDELKQAILDQIGR